MAGRVFPGWWIVVRTGVCTMIHRHGPGAAGARLVLISVHGMPAARNGRGQRQVRVAANRPKHPVGAREVKRLCTSSARTKVCKAGAYSSVPVQSQGEGLT